MRITVNGEVREVRTGLTAAELIAELELASRRFAVEINETVLPRSHLTEYRIRSGDRIEIVQAIGGG
ncbi:sulfur carrier protein ThiS [Nitrococcus mobilis]|uniref:sulfur carrier protein ThiS n=1 Tax=Nitrococcus mobilis TaxID=35797 RepID=UPI0005912B12|nr:sulfur carrier protein ThiS [Nitrococcus mobilis]